MNTVKSILLENADTRHIQFIFPSEVVAGFWRHNFLKITGKSAADSSRFLSWDRFKERHFSLTKDKLPVNKILRTMFAYRFLEENEHGRDLLPHLLHKKYAENSKAFLRYITSVLPSLSSLEEISDTLGKNDPETLRALLFLYNGYKDFLSHHQLFEPGFLKPDLSGLDRQVFLFFPELLEDYEEYRSIIENHPAIRTVPVSSGDGDVHRCRYTHFSNSVLEIHRLFREISGLLDEGIDGGDIAVTLGDEGLRDYVTAEAGKYGIPLNFRQGKPLTEYPAGRFFRAVRECGRTHFDIESLKTLLLSGSYPWKDRKVCEEFIREGIDSFCIRNVQNSWGKGNDRWTSAFQRRGRKDLAGFFNSLRNTIQAILSAKTFHDLHEHLKTFERTFFDTSRWSEQGGLVFQYSLQVLKELTITAGGFELPAGLFPFEIFFLVLEETMYVPRMKNPGISVFPYRVAAGIDPPFHFIAGLSHESSQILIQRFGFLRKDQKKTLGFDDRDCTRDFLQAYLYSGNSVFISGSAETFDGKTLVPDYFIEEQGEVELTAGPDMDDPYTAEESVWTEGRPVPEVLLPHQKHGAEWAGNTVFSGKGGDFTESVVEDPRLRELILQSILKEGTLYISASSLQAFHRCPFAYLLEKVADLSEISYSAQFSSSRLFGEFAHSVLRKVFGMIQEEDGAFLPENTEKYKEFSDSVCGSHFGSLEVRNGVFFLPPVGGEILGTLESAVRSLLEAEAKVMPGYKVGELESTYSCMEYGDYGLTGRLDRVSYQEGGACVVDYKKRARITRGQIEGSEDTEAVSFQMPLYIHLLDRSGIPVQQAVYVDVTQGSYKPVLGDFSGVNTGRTKPFTREEMDCVIESMLETARGMAEGINNGDFRPPAEGCDSCRFRSICRVMYTIR